MNRLELIECVKNYFRHSTPVTRTELREIVHSHIVGIKHDEVDRDYIWVAQNALLEEGIDIACHRGRFYRADQAQTSKRATNTWSAARRKASRAVARFSLAARTAAVEDRPKLENIAGHRADLLLSMNIRARRDEALANALKKKP